MKRTSLLLLVLLLVGGCMRAPEFGVYEGPMVDGKRVPLSAQVLVTEVAEDNVILVSWGDGDTSWWDGLSFKEGTANIQHIYRGEGVFEIRLWVNGRMLAPRLVQMAG